MEAVQIIIIAVSAVAVCFLAYFIIKSSLAPKRVEGINKLIKQGKTAAAVKLAKSIIAKIIALNKDKIKTINILKIFLIDNPNIPMSPKAEIAIDINKLAPITSSIANALFSVMSCITINEFTNIL